MPAPMNSSATSASSATVMANATAAISHWKRSSIPSFANRQQECRISAITAGETP